MIIIKIKIQSGQWLSMIHHLHCHYIAILTWKGCPYCFVSTTWQWILVELLGTSEKSCPSKSSELSAVRHWSEKPIEKRKKYVLSSSQVWSFLIIYMLDCLIFVVNCSLFSSSFSSYGRVNCVHSLVYFLFYI